jgi:hypothetical protein
VRHSLGFGIECTIFRCFFDSLARGDAFGGGWTECLSDRLFATASATAASTAATATASTLGVGGGRGLARLPGSFGAGRFVASGRSFVFGFGSGMDFRFGSARRVA